jgi:peptidoglycan hydrolase-like protein with peptidoglycan-binding domain
MSLILVRQRCDTLRRAPGRTAVAQMAALTAALMMTALTMAALLGGCGDDAAPRDPAFEEPSPLPGARRPWPLLRRGARGDEVVAAQYLLQHRGQEVAAEGGFDEATLAATLAFQRSRGLSADGIIGPLTWEALISEVTLGDSSPAVRAAQHLLVRRHGQALALDAVAGEATIAAIAAMQGARCLVVSGVAGVYTWSTLLAQQSYCQGGPSGKLTMAQVAALARAAGLPCGEPLALGVAIAVAESNLRGDALNRNSPTSGCADGSSDVGLWQINDCYHPGVSRACAFEAACNARAMVAISSAGTDWTPWTTYKNGAYRDSLAAAQAASAQACR